MPTEPHLVALVRELTAELDHELAVTLERTGITLLQLVALRALIGESSGLSVSGVAAATQLSVPSASRLCQRLEAAGNVERANGPGRSVLVRVTPSGRQLLGVVDDQRERALRDRAHSWSADQRRAVASLLLDPRRASVLPGAVDG